MVNEQKLLSIFIPTYNRNTEVNKRLDELMPLVKDKNVNIEVIDNCSKIPVSKTLKNEFDIYVNLTTNLYNVGSFGNVIKCFESCKTDWLWILSDDDEVLPDSINLILSYIDDFPDAQFINFSSDILKNFKREKDIYCNGTDEFIDGIDNFSNLMLISNNIVNVRKCLHEIKFAYLYSYALVPHIALQMVALNKDSFCIFSKQSIVRWNDPSKNMGSETWPIMRLMLAIPVINELPINTTLKFKRIFTRKAYSIVPSPIKYFSTILSEYDIKKDKFIFYAFVQTYQRMSIIDNSTFLQFYFCKALIFIFPVFESFLLFLNRCLRQSFSKSTSSAKEEFSRI